MKYPIGTRVVANGRAWPTKLAGLEGVVKGESWAGNTLVLFPERVGQEAEGDYGAGVWPMHDHELKELK